MGSALAGEAGRAYCVYVHDPQSTSPLTDALSPLMRQQASRLMVLGLVVGLLGGLGAVVCDLLAHAIAEVALGVQDPSSEPPTFWRALLAPAAGGLVASLAMSLFVTKGRPVGVADVVESVALRGGRMNLKDSLLTAAVASVILGTGGGGGREGPIMQLGAALASTLAKFADVPASRLRVLVAAGASAGIAASFNTPIAAAFFSMEILLGSFAADMFAPIVAATVAGTIVGQAFLGDRLALVLPPFSVQSPVEIFTYLGLGVVVGLVSVGFKATVFHISDAVQTMRVPAWARGGVMGLGIGLIAALGLHQVLGNGNGAIREMLSGTPPPIWLLLVLLFAKGLTSAAFFGARTGVGLLSPTLFVGATTGAIYGLLLMKGLPRLIPDHGAYGLVGMGAALAATTQAPITAILMLFEMTQNYQIILPLMLALVTATVTSRLVSPTGLYEETLLRRGVSLNRGREELVMQEVRVQDVMRDGAESIVETATAQELVRRFMARRLRHLYTVSAEGRYIGAIDLVDVRALFTSPEDTRTVIELTNTRVPALRLRMPLADCLPVFYRVGLDELPVVDEHERLLGVVTERDIVGAYYHEVLRGDALLARVDCVSPGQERETSYIELPEGETVASVEIGPRLAGTSLKVLSLPARFGLTVLAVSAIDPTTGLLVRRHIDATHKLKVGDRLVVLGPEDGVRRLREQNAAAFESGADDATEEINHHRPKDG